MGTTANWTSPGKEIWADAKDAFFVVGSDAIGGIGAPEGVPFATADDASAFTEKRGGEKFCG